MRIPVNQSQNWHVHPLARCIHTLPGSSAWSGLRLNHARYSFRYWVTVSGAVPCPGKIGGVTSHETSSLCLHTHTAEHAQLAMPVYILCYQSVCLCQGRTDPFWANGPVLGQVGVCNSAGISCCHQLTVPFHAVYMFIYPKIN